LVVFRIGVEKNNRRSFDCAQDDGRGKKEKLLDFGRLGGVEG
jgi:hypothetical protein